MKIKPRLFLINTIAIVLLIIWLLLQLGKGAKREEPTGNVTITPTITLAQELQNIIDNLIELIDELNNLINELSLKIEQLKQLINELNQSITLYNSIIVDLNTANNQFNELLNELDQAVENNASDEVLNEIIGRCNEKISDIDILQENCENAKTNVLTLYNNTAKLYNEITSLYNNQIVPIIQEIAELNIKLNDIKSRLDC